jgi:hypothetical protein
MDVSLDLILGPKFRFGLWEPIFFNPESTYFLHHTYFDRLMGHMTYFIIEPPSAQPRDPADPNFCPARLHYFNRKFNTLFKKSQ